ncbi:MAG: RluA family pseudouridine synthase [Bacteroidota bacterium]
MLIIEQHTVPAGVQKIRLLDYALLVFSTIPSKSSLKKIIKRGGLLVDGKPGQSGNWVVENQEITLIDLELKSPKPLDIELEIVFEDEHLAIINKPAGIEVSGNKYHTIQNALVNNIKLSSEPDALKWARPVHRLDMPTSGLLLVGKTATALMKLGQMLENRMIQKKYLAIVSGYVPKAGEIVFPIDNQKAISDYKCIDRCHSLKMQWLSLVELSPHTGRTHQLRIHMAKLEFPIVGDRLYGTGPLLKGKGLFLAAVELSFNHPINNNPITVKINQPKKFNDLMEREERRWERYNK